MYYIARIIFLLFIITLLLGCNKNLTKEEKEEMWSKAQTTNEIVSRSGTVFSTAKDKDLAMRDATTRLQTGGGLFGKKTGFDFSVGGRKDHNKQSNMTIGMPINPFLWRASLETIDFMSLASADPFGGIIITDWYSTESKADERCKLNIFIKGVELNTENLTVKSYCQKLTNDNWINSAGENENEIKIENAILNKAKKLKLSSG